jgi:zinc transport system ATP-binding protein
MLQIKCENLNLGYDGKTVVSGLSFSVNAGDYLCIVGDNGSGKSTLMKTLLKLQTPFSGQIIIGDGLTSSEIGYMPQQTEIQKDFPASVREVVRSGCLNRCGLRPFYSRTEKQMAEESMAKLGITSIAKRCYRELSGGQQQRALLARALCAAQKILLLDEPVSGLDPKASVELYDLIAQLNNEGITIIMISHDIAASAKYASHILHIDRVSEISLPESKMQQSALFFGFKTDYLKSDAGRIYAVTGDEQT